MLSATVASASAAFRRTQLATEGMPVRLVRKSMYQPGRQVRLVRDRGLQAIAGAEAERHIHETLIRVEAMRRRRRPNEAHPPDVGGLAALDVDGLAIDKRWATLSITGRGPLNRYGGWKSSRRSSSSPRAGLIPP